MVKADAYGHGAVEVSRKLVACGAAALGVATIEEGVELRAAEIGVPIIVLGGLMGRGKAACAAFIEYGLTPVIHSADVVDDLAAISSEKKKNMGVHLHIDTGMHRLGVRPEGVVRVLDRLAQTPTLSLEGVSTHFAHAAHDEVTKVQLSAFLASVAVVKKYFPHLSLCHMANSAAIVCGREVAPKTGTHWWVRPGIALYGACDGVNIPTGVELIPVMTLRTRIALLKWVPTGSRVSYEGTFTTTRSTRLAVVPLGYADGYPWSASNRGKVLIRGKHVPVVGRVTMDMTVLDVTDIADVHVGDDVVMFGRQGNISLRAEQLASDAGTISYEIFSRISKRVPRVYLG